MSTLLKLLAICLYMVIGACSRDTSEQVQPANIELRLSAITQFVHGTPQWRNELSYKDKRVSQVLEYEFSDDEWLLVAQTTVEYTGDYITIFYENLSDNTWTKEYQLQLSVVDGVLMERKVFCQNETYWIEKGKYVYNYRNGRLIDEVYSPIINGEYQLEYKTMCFYKEDRLFEIRDYEIQQVILWVCNRIFAFNTIDADHIEIIESVKNNLDEWNAIASYQLRFENGRISEYTTPEGSINFTYDEYGNLIQESNSAGEQIIYSYETGKGNAAILYMDPFVNQMGFPSIKSAQTNANIRSLIEMKTHE